MYIKNQYPFTAELTALCGANESMAGTLSSAMFVAPEDTGTLLSCTDTQK